MVLRRDRIVLSVRLLIEQVVPTLELLSLHAFFGSRLLAIRQVVDFRVIVWLLLGAVFFASVVELRHRVGILLGVLILVLLAHGILLRRERVIGLIILLVILHDVHLVAGVVLQHGAVFHFVFVPFDWGLGAIVLPASIGCVSFIVRLTPVSVARRKVLIYFVEVYAVRACGVERPGLRIVADAITVALLLLRADAAAVLLRVPSAQDALLQPVDWVDLL